MSVFFQDSSKDNPVRQGDVKGVLAPLGLSVPEHQCEDYRTLLAAVHDCAERVCNLPDYQPKPSLARFPRTDVRIPRAEEQDFGHAWAHRFTIRGDRSSTPSPLSGKTVCVKDCVAVAGIPQFFGSDAFPAWTPSTDATVVTRVLEAGADVVGTATCEHFCNSTSSFTSAQGTVENPHKHGYSAGGSTSGGAALVSGNVVDIAIGTDQGGSIRVPAALCGCVGMKPTHGLVPYTGVTSGDPIDDHVGPLTRDVRSAAACLDAMAGYDGIDDRCVRVREPGSFEFSKTIQHSTGRLDNVRIGVLKEGIDSDFMQTGVKTTFANAAKGFERLGATVQEVSIPLHKEAPFIWTIQQRMAGSAGILGHSTGRRGLQLTEFERARLPWTPQSFDKLFPSTKNTVINGLYLRDRFPGLYSKTVNIGRQICDAYQEAFEAFDAIVMPTTPFVAPRHGDRESVLGSFKPSMGLTINTAVFNVTGHPAISIPMGEAEAADGDGGTLLPVGLQVVGGLWQDARVLQIAHAFEQQHKNLHNGDS